MPGAVVVRPRAHAPAVRPWRGPRGLLHGAEGLRGVRVRCGERRALSVLPAALLVAGLHPDVLGVPAPARVRLQPVELVQPDRPVDVVRRGLVCEQRRWPPFGLIPREFEVNRRPRDRPGLGAVVLARTSS